MPKRHLKLSYKKESSYQKRKKIKIKEQADGTTDTATETTDTADSDFCYDDSNDLEVQQQTYSNKNINNEPHNSNSNSFIQHSPPSQNNHLQCQSAETHHDSDQQTNIINEWCKQAGEPDFLTNFSSSIQEIYTSLGNY